MYIYIYRKGSRVYVLERGRALGVCPDAIRSCVRITHVLQCLEGLLRIQSQGKRSRIFYVGFVTCELLVMSGRKVCMFVFTIVRSVSCSSERVAYSRNTRFFSPVVDGPNL